MRESTSNQATILKTSVLVACMGWLPVAATSAAVMEVDNYNRTTAYTVATDDLLQVSGQLTSESGISESGSAVLNDGVNGNRAGASNGFVVYTLDTLASPAGYTISNINVYGGWVDPGRDEQKFNVSYSTVAAPGTFISLHDVDYNPPASGGIGSGSVYTSVALSSDSGPMAQGVAAVKFTFKSAENGFSGYSELDVIGTAVPEPASLGLLAMGGLALLARRRRLA